MSSCHPARSEGSWVPACSGPEQSEPPRLTRSWGGNERSAADPTLGRDHSTWDSAIRSKQFAWRGSKPDLLLLFNRIAHVFEALETDEPGDVALPRKHWESV